MGVKITIFKKEFSFPQLYTKKFHGKFFCNIVKQPHHHRTQSLPPKQRKIKNLKVNSLSPLLSSSPLYEREDNEEEAIRQQQQHTRLRVSRERDISSRSRETQSERDERKQGGAQGK